MNEKILFGYHKKMERSITHRMLIRMKIVIKRLPLNQTQHLLAPACITFFFTQRDHKIYTITNRTWFLVFRNETR